MQTTAFLLAGAGILAAGCSGDGGIEVTATYRREAFEPTRGVAIDSTPSINGTTDGVAKHMGILLSTGSISCAFTIEKKEELPEGKHVFIDVFTQEAGEALPVLASVAITAPDGKDKVVVFGSEDIRVDISSVDDGRVVGEVSGSTEVEDPSDMSVTTASANGSFDVERCF